MHLLLLFLGGSAGLFSQNRQFERVDDPHAGLNSQILGIAKDSIGFMWFGTRSGLHRFNGKEYDTYTPPVSKGWPIADDRIRNMISDEDRQIWALTADQRYIRYSYPQDSFYLPNQARVPAAVKTRLALSATVLNENKPVDGARYFIEGNQLKAVDLENGKETIHYPYPGQPGHLRENFVSTFYVDEEQTLWVATWGGKILKVTHPTYSPVSKLVLSRLYIGGQAIDAGQSVFNRVVLDQALMVTNKITLDHHHRDFGIDLLTLTQDTVGHTYQYRLLGYQEQWLPTKHRRIDFTKVPSGEYTFQARAVAADGTLTETVDLKVAIKPPWYASPNAVGLYHLSMIFGLASCVVYRKKRTRFSGEEEISDGSSNTSGRRNRKRQQTRMSGIGRSMSEYGELNSASPGRRTSKPVTAKQGSKVLERENDTGRVESSDLTLNYTLVNGVGIIEEVIEAFNPVAEARNISYSCTSPAELIGRFDPDKLRYIVTNLITTAFKHTPLGGKISLTIKALANTLYISAENTKGCISNTDESDSICQPTSECTQVPMGICTEAEDLLAQTYVELLNGTIRYKSEPRKRMWVEIGLPYQPEEALAANQAPSEEVFAPSSTRCKASGEDSKPSTVLIVEDNPEVRRYLEIELNIAHRVLAESNGIDGLSTASREIPDLIVSDVLMPGMDGTEMCKRLKQSDRTSHIPIILLTAKGHDHDRVAGLSSGADVYFSKPFNVAVLKAQIQSMIANRTALKRNAPEKDDRVEEADGQSRLDKSFISSAVEVIERHMADTGFNPELLADHLNISPRQLYRKLNTISGSTASGFIMQVRMEKAADLLKDWKLNVSEVATRVGISEASNFSRAFRKHYDCSPTRYRKNL
ncbi:MAG: response regulator [Lewinella sp.]